MNHDHDTEGPNDCFQKHENGNPRKAPENTYTRLVFDYMRLEYGIVVHSLSTTARQHLACLLATCVLHGVNVPNAAGCITELMQERR
jgi:hypothetical protein